MPVQPHLELRHGVEPRLLRPPIEAAPPMTDQLAQVGDVGAVGPGRARRLVREAGARETLLEVADRLLGNLQHERLRSPATPAAPLEVPQVDEADFPARVDAARLHSRATQAAQVASSEPALASISPAAAIRRCLPFCLLERAPQAGFGGLDVADANASPRSVAGDDGAQNPPDAAARWRAAARHGAAPRPSPAAGSASGVGRLARAAGCPRPRTGSRGTRRPERPCRERSRWRRPPRPPR